MYHLYETRLRFPRGTSTEIMYILGKQTFYQLVVIWVDWWASSEYCHVGAFMWLLGLIFCHNLLLIQNNVLFQCYGRASGTGLPLPLGGAVVFCAVVNVVVRPSNSEVEIFWVAAKIWLQWLRGRGSQCNSVQTTIGSIWSSYICVYKIRWKQRWGKQEIFFSCFCIEPPSCQC